MSWVTDMTKYKFQVYAMYEFYNYGTSPYHFILANLHIPLSNTCFFYLLVYYNGHQSIDMWTI